ncbi:MAG: SRPBCC family protein [Caulobacteraceae bacterium]|nr:SRPBCC family protein [Caulobacteraceae bacterium]
MATVVAETFIETTPERVWDAARDYGALHTRLVPGFVIATEVVSEEGTPVRIVRFGSGAIARETMVTVDDEHRRVVWSIRGETVRHHNGALRIEGVDGGCRVEWTADVLPAALAEIFEPAMRQGLAAMKAHFEAA